MSEALAATRDPSIKVIAFYLPQFHPIPENDAAWGRGFTEWANVVRAKPLFDGHYQPQLPTETGFYDLRIPEVLEEQASLAREHGLHGFCHYFYWFDGRRVLERPVEQMLRSGKPEFPFCLCWANENWSRRWDSSDDEIIIEQNFAARAEIIHDLLPYFRDSRYIRIDGRPLFLVYRPDIVPELEETLRAWRETARHEGMELYLAACLTFGFDQVEAAGFDGAVEFPPHGTRAPDIADAVLWTRPVEAKAHDYATNLVSELLRGDRLYPVFRCAMASWDNTARLGAKARIFVGSNPEIFELWLSELVKRARLAQNPDHRIVFVNAWNEWAEGAHLEPDDRYGRQWLAACERSLSADGPPLEDRELAGRFTANPHVRLQMAQHLHEMDRTHEAIEEVREAILIDPQSHRAHRLAARLLEFVGREADAVDAYRQAIACSPPSDELYAALARLLFKAGRWDEAAIAARAAVAINPRQSGGYVHLAATLHRQGYDEEASHYFASAIELIPDDPEKHLDAARLLLQLGRWDHARTCFTRAIVLQPNHLQAVKEFSSACSRNGEADAGIQLVEQALALKPDSTDLNHHRGILLGFAGRWREAAEAQRRALELEPGHQKAKRLLSQALAKTGNLDEALDLAHENARAHPESPAEHHHLGNVLALAARWEEAVGAQEKALELHPDHPGALRQLANARAKLGSADRGIGGADCGLV